MAGWKHQTAESNCVCVEPLNAEERALVKKAMQGGANNEKVATMQSGRGTIAVYRGMVPGQPRESTSPTLCRREFKKDTGEPPRGDAAGLVIQRDIRRNKSTQGAKTIPEPQHPDLALL